MNDPKSWSQYLNYAVLSINSMKSSSSGYTPFELLHGISPLDIQLPKPKRYTNTDQEQAYQHWYKNLTNMRDIARDILNSYKQVKKTMYERKCEPHNLKI